MQSSVLAEPGDRNIKAADVADFAEVAKIVEVGVSSTARSVRWIRRSRPAPYLEHEAVPLTDSATPANQVVR
jgi:hypothetical protein